MIKIELNDEECPQAAKVKSERPRTVKDISFFIISSYTHK